MIQDGRMRVSVAQASQLQVLVGGAVFTEPRQQQLKQRLAKQGLTLPVLAARYYYFIESASPLAAEALKQLQTLLPDFASEPCAASPNFWVVPRLGTTSPWSSKALDILQNCQLTEISRIERGVGYFFQAGDNIDLKKISAYFYDPMTESVLTDAGELQQLFNISAAKSYATINFLEGGETALLLANEQLGLALNKVEMDYLLALYQKLKRNPSDVELMMFAQVNSEHCRHKTFNAKWTLNAKEQSQTLFGMIKNTQAQNPEQAIVAYHDNAAVLKGSPARRWFVNSQGQYRQGQGYVPIVFKVETHNHPTAISPTPGAATGSGGEIRDEGATGRGAQPVAGMVGFSVSDLHIPNFAQPWEVCLGKPQNIASALDIMLQAPVGAASFNNEFGRPGICGYFRTFSHVHITDYGEVCWGYHKPIMLAGGIGHIRLSQVKKKTLRSGVKIIVLGGPSMLIGLGGGSASSQTSGKNREELDFASVQRANAEMQRRAQEVINACCALIKNNPILSIHDVGAGGLSNAVPEIVAACDRGVRINLRAIPVAEQGMTPLQIWCNEAQERYVLAIAEKNLALFTQIASRERCGFAVIGEVTKGKNLVIYDDDFANYPVNLPMAALFKALPLPQKTAQSKQTLQPGIDTSSIDIAEALKRVLQVPCVADKSFLITIADRSVTGLVCRDQMVGPWQIPVADVAVTCHDYVGKKGMAMAVGERAPLALLHHAASARMAVGEAITNIAAASIESISKISLSANWMAAADYPGEDAGLFEAVQAIGMELCPALGINIPVGKDSLSMRTSWQSENQARHVTSPLSLVITAAAPVVDVGKTLTPQLQLEAGETELWLLDLGGGCNSLGGSVLAQSFNLLGQRPPDVNNPALLKNFFKAIQALNQQDLLLAYHDRSDGGLITSVCEMLFAGHCGARLEISALGDDAIASLFAEELGAVIQIKQSDRKAVLQIIEQFQLQNVVHNIGTVEASEHLAIYCDKKIYYQAKRVDLQGWWSQTSYQLQALRDNPLCAKQAYAQIAQENNTGLSVKLSFNAKQNPAAAFIRLGVRPKVAILREQGVNGHMEMAAAFYQAGFDCYDVHMSDILSSRVRLKDFIGLVACGGFSYGDVLGAGRGWAQTILMNPRAYDEFSAFFQNPNTFTLGVCNGCQMLAQLKSIIPGAQDWPSFVENNSAQFEARFSLVKIKPSPSLFFQDMQDSVLPVAVAHGEGQVQFAGASDLAPSLSCLNYVDYQHQPTEIYPHNPNGSAQGLTGFCSTDGRVTIMMPHPERVFRTLQCSWYPKEWGAYSPWMRFFYNARAWVG